MTDELKVAIIGLDTSHSVEFPRILQAPDQPEDKRIKGMRAVTCLRFDTPFQNKEGLDTRQKQLESWGVKVTTDFNEAVKDCDAILLEINDAAFHLEYFNKCADLGKPIFLDKPLADTIANGRKIYNTVKEKKLRVFSASSLRFAPELPEACKEIPAPFSTSVYGPLGQAPAGSSIVWYGVHTFEMLQRAMGNGAQSVLTVNDGTGAVVVVEYPGQRHGIVELTNGVYKYGGCLRSKEKAVPFSIDGSSLYQGTLEQITRFFKGSDTPVSMDDTLEIMALLDAAEKSLQSGKKEQVQC